MKTARDYMTSPVHTLPRTATVLEAARLLLEKRVTGVVVVNGKGGADGMFTLRDLAKFFLDPRMDVPGSPPDPRVALASELMTHRVISVKPEASVEEMRKAMRSSRVHRLVVEDRGRIAGVVSASDLATKNV